MAFQGLADGDFPHRRVHGPPSINIRLSPLSLGGVRLLLVCPRGANQEIKKAAWALDTHSDQTRGAYAAKALPGSARAGMTGCRACTYAPGFQEHSRPG